MSNTTTSLALTEFLLARIDEDEADAGNLMRFEFDPATGQDIGHSQRLRVEVECETKRQIVDQFPWSTVLYLLAQPYGDHPDYDEAWRP